MLLAMKCEYPAGVIIERASLIPRLFHFLILNWSHSQTGSSPPPLPQVLLGLQDPQDEMVQATLRALADLVPLLGAEAVMGTSRKAMFADTKPRVCVCVGVCVGVCVWVCVGVCVCVCVCVGVGVNT